MQHTRASKDEGGRSGDPGTAAYHEDVPPILTVPPALIGFLVLLAVVLACTFYIAAQVVQTP